MKTADLYIRVSTDEQANTGYSQRYQEETLRRYCQVNNIAIRSIFFEDHSAKNFQRPEFAKILLLLKKQRNTTDLLLFTKWDRFSRNAGDAYGMINTLNKLGVEPQAIEQPLNLEIPENKMMLAFYLAAPEVENDRRSLNIIGGMRRARKEGRVMGKAPMGYTNTIIDGRKTIALNGHQADIMRWAFEEIARGILTVRSVLHLCKQKGLVTITGAPVCKTPFWVALRNPVYYGKIRIGAYKGEGELLAQGTHQPLISEALFNKVQAVLDGKKKTMRTKLKVDPKFPLRGFLICTKCGKPLTASSSKGRNGYYDYYHCFDGCKVRGKAADVNGQLVEELSRWKPHPAVSQLYKIVLQDLYREGNRNKQTTLKKLREELNRLTEYKTKIRKMRINDELAADDYQAEKTDCENRMLQIEEELVTVTSSTNIETEIETAYRLLSQLDTAYLSAPVEWQRDLIGSMFPEKMQFDGQQLRTAKVNEVAQAIFSMGEAFSQIKMSQIRDIKEMAHYVEL